MFEFTADLPVRRIFSSLELECRRIPVREEGLGCSFIGRFLNGTQRSAPLDDITGAGSQEVLYLVRIWPLSEDLLTYKRVAGRDGIHQTRLARSRIVHNYGWVRGRGEDGKGILGVCIGAGPAVAGRKRDGRARQRRALVVIVCHGRGDGGRGSNSRNRGRGSGR